MKDIKLDILSGLPGSGKTTFAKELGKQSKNTCVIHLDDVKDSLFYVKNKTIETLVQKGLCQRTKETNRIVLDGLFLTNQDLLKAISAVANCYNSVEVTIHRWDEDRDACVKNDGGRREVSSVTTILNATYETPDVEMLNKELAEQNTKIIDIVNHKVQLKPDWILHFRAHTWCDEDGKMRSQKWCTGGAYGNCWDSHLSPVSPDDPLTFTQLDELLEKVAPSITFLHYKKIEKECVSTEESYDRDYYGGGTTHLNWVCDLPKLYKMLNEFGYID